LAKFFSIFDSNYLFGLTNFKNHIQLGNGIYTIPDLALILQLPQPKVRRWLTDFYDERLAGDKDKYSWGTGKDRATNFLTLIEFYIFYLLRDQKIGAGKILEAHKHMSKELKTPYPFASHQLLINSKSIFYQVTSDTWVHADKTNQIVIHKLIEQFCKKIDFANNSLAKRFWPLGKNHSVVVDPEHQFGQPVITGTNINAATIYSMYQSGEPIPTIGILYDLTEEQVNDAIFFCKRKAA
jgi:uncharacterized protein (DUF433 family)